MKKNIKEIQYTTYIQCTKSIRAFYVLFNAIVSEYPELLINHNAVKDFIGRINKIGVDQSRSGKHGAMNANR